MRIETDVEIIRDWKMSGYAVKAMGSDKRCLGNTVERAWIEHRSQILLQCYRFRHRHAQPSDQLSFNEVDVRHAA